MIPPLPTSPFLEHTWQVPRSRQIPNRWPEVFLALPFVWLTLSHLLDFTSNSPKRWCLPWSLNLRSPSFYSVAPYAFPSDIWEILKFYVYLFSFGNYASLKMGTWFVLLTVVSHDFGMAFGTEDPWLWVKHPMNYVQILPPFCRWKNSEAK